MDIGAMFEVAVALTAEHMDAEGIRSASEIDPWASATGPLEDRVQALLWDDDDPDRAVTLSLMLARAAEVLAEVTLVELDQRAPKPATDSGCPWGVRDILPTFPPDLYDVNFSHTGGGCYAIEVTRIDDGPAGSGDPYILITGEDVYDQDDYEQISGEHPHLFTVGLYDHEDDGTVGGCDTAVFRDVVGAHHLPQTVADLFATVPGGGTQ